MACSRFVRNNCAKDEGTCCSGGGGQGSSLGWGARADNAPTGAQPPASHCLTSASLACLQGRTHMWQKLQHVTKPAATCTSQSLMLTTLAGTRHQAEASKLCTSQGMEVAYTHQVD